MNVKPLWMFVHNCLVHPLMGVVELLTWDHWMPAWLLRLHESTARRAGF